MPSQHAQVGTMACGDIIRRAGIEDPTSTSQLRQCIHPRQTRFAKENESHALGKLQIDHATARRALEQVPIVRRLLHHLRVGRVPVDPSLLVVAVAVDETGKEGLGGGIGGVVGRVGEFVEGEGEREECYGYVEAFLRLR